MHARNGVEQFHHVWAQRARRGQEVIVPFQVKAFPAALEERVHTPIVVLRRRALEAVVEQANSHVADGLPIFAEGFQLRKLIDRDHRLVRHRRGPVHQHIVGREIDGVVAELARDAQPLLAAEMNVDRRCRQHIEN
jgi:hypothetical protein